MTERKWNELPYQYFFKSVIQHELKADLTTKVVPIRKETQMENVTKISISPKDFQAIQTWLDTLPTQLSVALVTAFATIHAAYVVRDYGTEQAYTAAWRDLLTGLKYGGQFFASSQAA